MNWRLARRMGRYTRLIYHLSNRISWALGLLFQGNSPSREGFESGASASSAHDNFQPSLSMEGRSVGRLILDIRLWTRAFFCKNFGHPLSGKDLMIHMYGVRIIN